ncbi:MAG TPA: PAS domain S-box protein [Pyrinomonadaceae bacterium]|nr:PAS domain S-box protein [Pyrinomonadaceae bacterium]
MENSLQEIKLLQSCINDLLSVLTLPAIWTGGDSSQVIITLLDALVSMLRLDFAYARFLKNGNGSEIDILRLAKGQATRLLPEDVGLTLKGRLTKASPALPASLPNPVGEGEVFIAPLRLGLKDEIGFLVAASKRRDFPTRIETLLLRVVANQAVVGLQEAHLLSEQKRAAEELERRIADRTQQVTAVNAELVREIGERERAEEALRSSEERFRRYFELGLIGMAITSPDKGCLEVNDELCRILGYERSQLLQKSWDELTHPDDLAADVSQFNRVLAGEIDGYTLDKRWICKDGRVIDTIMAAQCVRRADDSVDYFVGLVQDITERKQAEDSVRKARERVDMIVNSISDNFFGLDHEGRFTYFNKHAADQMRSLGKDPDALIGKVAWEEFPDAPNEDSFHRVLSERVVVADELYYAQLGEWIENHIYPSNDGGLVTFQRYITQRKRTEDELHKAHAELAHVARVTTLGELTASIAHEVNQPLAAIVTNGQASLRLLSRSKPDIEEAREAVQSMIDDSLRASEVIKRIRALLRKTGPAKSTLNVNDVIREVIAFTAEELKKNQVSLLTELGPDLPVVIGDRVQLQQVMLNLILNGNEAMRSPECETRELLLRSERSGPDRVLITVQDTGIGLNSKDQERVFDAFFTLKEGGLGLGLSISRTIIEGHGGRLWATPNEGPGTSFQFLLPTGVENQ